MLALLLLVAATPPAPSFTADTFSGPTISGPLASIGLNWSVTFADPAATVKANDLLSFHRTDAPRPAWPTEPGLILANGDRVPGTVAGGDDTALTLTPAVGKPTPWRVPLPSVRVVWVAAPPADTPAFPDRYAWLPADRKTDVVLLRNGDVVRGSLERFTPGGGVRLTAEGATAATELPADTVAAVGLNPALTVARKPKGALARLVTVNGSRLTLTAATADAATLRGTTGFGAKVEVPLADVVALDILHGKAAYLSDLRPKVAHEPFAGLAWEWAADRSVKARPLTLTTPRGVETFDKGVGSHPRTTLTYALGGKYRRFEATVGLDAVTGRRGAVAVRVLVDDKPADTPGLATLTAAAVVPVRVDVTRAKRLTLLVDFGPGGDVQADVNWADARLVE